MIVSKYVRLGDVGTQFRIAVTDSGSPLNLAAASSKQILFCKPSGIVLTKTAELLTDGTDGVLCYTVEEGFFDETGRWLVQAWVVLPLGAWYSEVSEFRVAPNLQRSLL
jgi:hypothetical protein